MQWWPAKNVFRIFLSIGLFTLQAQAQDPSFEEKWIERNRQVSKYFDDMARELDFMLSGRRAEESNRSQLTLIGFVEASETLGVQPDGHVNVDLRLPAFEEDIKLRLSSFDADDEFEGLARNRTNARPQTQKLGTSVAIGREFSGVRVIFRPRVELRDPLLTSFLLKFSQDLPLGLGRFIFRHQLRFLVHSRDGAGQSYSAYLETPLGNSVVFRLVNEQQYLDQTNLFSVSQGPMFLAKVSERFALSKTFVLNSQNRSTITPFAVPNPAYNSYHLNSYQAILSLNYQLYRNVLHVQLSPSLNFYKELRFRGDPAVMLRTELIF